MGDNLKVQNKIIIWGVDDYNVLGLYRQLGGRGLDILFLIFQGLKHCAVVSKYCTSYHAETSLENGLNYLISKYSTETIKPIIITSNDLIAEFLDLHQEKIEPYFIIPKTTTPGSLASMDDKSKMNALAHEIGFLTPRSINCRWNTSVANVAYPCLLKPTHQIEGKYNEFKFKICENKRQLTRTLRYVRKDSDFILQQYIPVKSVDLIYGCRMKNGEIILAGILEKDRFCHNGDGSHGILMSDFPSYIDAELIKLIIEKVDFYGLFSVEYGISQNRAYFFEVNWRNDGTSHLFYQAGANIPLAWIYDAAGLNYHEIQTKVASRSVFIDELFDIQNIGKNGLTKKNYKEQLSKATIFKYFDTEDIKPYEIVKKRKRKKLFIDYIVAKHRLYIVYLMDKLGIKRK